MLMESTRTSGKLTGCACVPSFHAAVLCPHLLTPPPLHQWAGVLIFFVNFREGNILDYYVAKGRRFLTFRI